MSRLLATICLLGMAAFFLSGGCTPEANKTWSETADFSELDVRFGGNISGTYEVDQSLQSDFVLITLVETGSSVQGYDNMGRSWFGSLSGSVDPTITVHDDVPTSSNPSGGNTMNLETSDDPRGRYVIIASMEIIVVMTLAGPECHTGFMGQFYTEQASGYIEGLGRVVPCEITTQ
jgi:hypothetical protein